MLLRILLILFLFSFSNLYCWSQELKIHFLDVGQGDAIFIETPGKHKVLIDTGNIISGFKVRNYLNSAGAKHLDYLILTHPHLDHIGGVFLIAQDLSFDKIADNGQDLGALAKFDIYAGYERLVRNSSKYQVLSAGDSFRLDGVNLEVLWPPSDPGPEGDFNVNSLVIMVKYNNFTCLLTGDLTVEAEEAFFKKNSDIKSDILKAGHHGAADANSRRFLEAVSPVVTVVSAGKGNKYGYPSPETLQRISNAGAQILRTDLDGDITLNVDKGGRIRISCRGRACPTL